MRRKRPKQIIEDFRLKIEELMNSVDFKLMSNSRSQAEENIQRQSKAFFYYQL